MNLSYWEKKSWLSNVDFTIIGSGLVGLNCALQLSYRFPKAKILILEKGMIPQGASTKNAGFACFGSLSEIIDDLNHHTEEEVINLVKKRLDGLTLLRNILGDNSIDYYNDGGYELFANNDEELYDSCLSKRDDINSMLFPLFKENVFTLKDNKFKFQNIKPIYSFNQFEGQLDTGKMMESLLEKVVNRGIKILNNCEVKETVETLNAIKVKTSTFEFSSSKLIIATNGFASELIEEEVRPARAQVLITKPIDNLQIKGTFHLDKGYYYFRNIDNRILFGGGRHLDFKGEETTEFNQTELIQMSLETILKNTILPKTFFEVDYSWSGIMGVGKNKKPIVKQLSDRVFCGVRLGGMGVAIGSLVGKELADLL